MAELVTHVTEFVAAKRDMTELYPRRMNQHTCMLQYIDTVLLVTYSCFNIITKFKHPQIVPAIQLIIWRTCMWIVFHIGLYFI